MHSMELQWGYRHERLQLAQLLGQLGVFLTCSGQASPNFPKIGESVGANLAAGASAIERWCSSESAQ
jgi:hypothetical protein